MNQTSQKKDNFLIRYLVPDTNLWIEKMNDIKKVSLYFFCFLTHIIHLYHKSLWTITIYGQFKVGSVFTMIISSESRMEQYCNDDHWEDAPQFMVRILKHILIAPRRLRIVQELPATFRIHQLSSRNCFLV